MKSNTDLFPIEGSSSGDASFGGTVGPTVQFSPWTYQPPAESAHINIQEVMEKNEAMLKEWETLLSSNDFSDACYQQQQKLKSTLNKSFTALAKMADAQIRAMRQVGASNSSGVKQKQQDMMSPQAQVPAQSAPGASMPSTAPPSKATAQASLNYSASSGYQGEYNRGYQPQTQLTADHIRPDDDTMMARMLQHTRDQLEGVPETQHWIAYVDTAIRLPENENHCFKAFVEMCAACLQRFNLPGALQAQDFGLHTRLTTLISMLARIAQNCLTEVGGIGSSQGLLRKLKTDWESSN